jgi:light-regulated signal transduction histidine kinase (bacteriophytochrome)
VTNTGDAGSDLVGILDGALHDLREPSGVLCAFTDWLSDHPDVASVGSLEPRLARARRAAKRMNGLIDALRIIARAERTPPKIEAIDCNAIMSQVALSLSVASEEAGAAITHGPLPIVSADAERLGIVLQELLGNAIKFRGAAPLRAHVAIEPTPNGWQISVGDNGIGIESEFLERVFRPFERLHAREVYPGQGLGLTLCQRIVSSHGGRIWAVSRPGEGSTFHFTLPGPGSSSPEPR